MSELSMETKPADQALQVKPVQEKPEPNLGSSFPPMATSSTANPLSHPTKTAKRPGRRQTKAVAVRVFPGQTANGRPNKIISLAHYKPILTSIQVAVDAATVLLSFVSAYFLWKWIGPVLAIEAYEPESITRYASFLGVTLATVMVGLEVHGLYKPQRSLMNVREFELLLKTWGKACLFSLAILFMAQQLLFSRGVFVMTWSIMLVGLLVERYAFFKFNNWVRRKGFVETTCLIYGAGEVGRKLHDKFRESPKLGLHVAGFLDDEPALIGKVFHKVSVIGDFTKLRETIVRTGATKLFIALSQVPSKVVIDIMNVCRETGCEFQIVPSLYDIVIQRVKITELEGIPLIGLAEPRYSWKTAFLKRIFDLVAGSLLMVALSPIFLALALTVKLSSKGPIIFVQKRIGLNGKRFLFYKFRSMYTEAPKYGVTPQSGKDPRITPIGRFLRRSSLDELPQLWSVIKGDMSLVGPRPEMPFIVSKYNDLHRQRLNVKPGITGLWQISADRKNAIHENMDYDIYYINNQSFLLDLVILARTVLSCIKGVGAY
jgi:exopolysaccharide biosynthesis polyprenyl glycosylphosphotransferase